MATNVCTVVPSSFLDFGMTPRFFGKYVHPVSTNTAHLSVVSYHSQALNISGASVIHA